MPIYEYRCRDCERVFEALQRVAEDPLETCRHCGGSAKRIVSSPAIHFVGSGWYVNDYAKKGAQSEGSEKDGSAPRQTPSSESETKRDAGKTTDSGKAAADAAKPSAAGDARARSPS